jgi:HEPN domain-containing protein
MTLRDDKLGPAAADPGIRTSHDAALGWLRWAQGDFLAAERCSQVQAIPAWVIGFHCQQAVEKACKAMLVAKGVEPPRSHDLVRLAEVLEAAGLPPPAPPELCDALSPFAVADRYPVLSAPDRLREEVDPLVPSVAQVLANVQDWLQRAES